MGTQTRRGPLRRLALVLCVVFCALLLLPASPAGSLEAQPTPGPAITPPVPADPPELSPTQKARLEKACKSKDLEFVPESDACSHGGDPPPKGKSIYQDVKPVMAAAPARNADGVASTTAQAGPPACDGDGVSGPRTQVMYVRASDVPDRFATFRSSIIYWAGGADSIYRFSAAQTGGTRGIRFVHDSSCTPVVLNVTIPPAADDNFNATIGALEAQGHDRTDRNYMLFVEANVYCGVSTIELDDRPGQDNANNVGPSYGRTDAGCWSADVPAHEHMHNMGGVQMSAPHASGGMHCTDEHDVMCYSDPPDFPSMQMMCSDPVWETDRFDCNYDDYFNANPPAGSYLATRWNTANNQFLIGGGSRVCPDASIEPDDGPGTARPISLGAGQSHAFCTAGDSDWVRFDGAAGRTYRIAVGSIAGGADPVVQVFGNTGRMLLRSADPPGATSSLNLDFTARNAEAFYVRIADNFSSSPSPGKTYTLTVASGSIATRVAGWGYNGAGGLGLSAVAVPFVTTPQAPALALTSGQVSAGVLHSLALGTDNAVWAFGWNVNGQLGDGTFTDRHAPIRVPGIDNAVSVSAGGLHSLAVKADGTVWSWGWNGFGQLGDGTTETRPNPVRVPGLTDVVEVAAGTWHSLALKRDGSVWAWGWNVYGGLGDGTQTTRLLPVKVPIDSVRTLSAGGFHTLVAKRDGSLWAWGYNPNGQLGDGSRSDRHLPVRINGISDVYMASAGLAHSVAVRNDGSVWAWGWNANQQTGSFDLADKLAPQPVLCSLDPACPRGQGFQLGRVARVGAGGFHSTAIGVDGRVWSWGLNNLGQLGNGASADSARAVAAAGAVLSEVAAGFVHSLGG